MLTRLTVRNFKRFDAVDIELGNPVVFVGPNNSGKTTALQALALWEIGVRKWAEKRLGREAPEKRPGVTINRKDLLSLPVPSSNLLWRNLHYRDTERTNGTQRTRNVRIEVGVEGVSNGAAWTFCLEFDYANEESFYCRPVMVEGKSPPERMVVPPEATEVRIGFLPPMSGLVANEVRLDPGAVQVRLGEGRTAEVLRNLCHQLHSHQNQEAWKRVETRIESLFGVHLEPPRYIEQRGEIEMTYRDRDGPRLDLSSAGRGLQQTLLLLAYVGVSQRGSVLLLDEPDAHLEILRQRQVYQLLSEAAQGAGAQIIAASHSEVVLNEAADRDVVVAFIGKPHRIDDRGTGQVLKSLKEIGFDQYYQAEQRGWVLYLEGSTDLAILQALARQLGHEAARYLESPFVHYVQNQPAQARHHFHGLREAKPDLVALAVFDRLQDSQLATAKGLEERMWRRREIENYIATQETLLAWAADAASVFGGGELFAETWKKAMLDSIREIESALRTLGTDPWSADTKITNEFLDRVFPKFFERLSLPMTLMRKTDYHALARHMQASSIDPEVTEMLDRVVAVARSAKPISGQ